MTRKHFEALAAALAHNAPNPDSNAFDAEAELFRNIVNDVAQACRGVNCRFDYERFAKASGLAAIRNSRDSEMRLTRTA